MMLLLLFAANAVMAADNAEVLAAVRSTLAAQGIELCEAGPDRYATPAVEIAPEAVNRFITDNMPDDNPGWKRARYTLTIEIEQAGPEAASLTVTAAFERYGVPNAYLLIPDAWVPVPSSGALENELLALIKSRLAETNETGGVE